MKILRIVVIFICTMTAVPSYARENRQMPQGIPPEAMEQIRKMLPPGVQLPPGFGMPGTMPATTMSSGTAGTPTPQKNSYTPLPDSSASLSPSGSGRTPEQRAAALAIVNAELDRLPYILPKKEDAPTRSAVLKIAGDRNAAARKKFGPMDLSTYSRAVTWTLRFDGLQTDGRKARDYSLSVASVTNYFNMPHFVIAFASAVFSLDPHSTSNAGNFASAIITAGERLNLPASQAKTTATGQAQPLDPYRRDAESVYLYALALSMDKDDWTDASLTPILNLGNLYIDMGRLEEARSLFQVARNQSPFSWDAALGMAAYFHAIGKPDKALAILEDDNLDRPVSLMVAKKAAKALEKSEEYAGLPADAPEEKFAEGIKAVNSEPITTAADFMAQMDQSERNKMRYFIEHLPPQGSFTAPKINKLTQYASAQAISSIHGVSAMKDFHQMLQNYAITTSVSVATEQLKMLSRMGMDLNLGIDLDDVAKHPEKYANSKHRPKVKVDKSKLMANLQKLQNQAETARRELATGKTGTLIEMVAQLDPFFKILQMNPEEYADPMNINIQKHNFAVHNRKVNLYNGCLYSVNKRISQAVVEIQKRYSARMEELEARQTAEEAELDASEKDDPIARHNIHTRFFNGANGAAEAAFGSATNLTNTNYVNKIKPTAEAYYYDVIRHVGLISDPDVRMQKDAELRRNINSALVMALGTVAMAHGSFHHYDEFECGCSQESLARAREQQREARDAEENARIARNMAAKVAFDSGEIPPSTPLYERLDAYGTDFDFYFFKGRISCIRTEVNFNISLPVPGSPEISLSQSISENTGAATYGQGIKLGVGVDETVGGTKVNVGAYLDLSSSVKTDGQGVVKDYSVTAGTGLKVSASGTTVSVGGQLTIGKGGDIRDSDFSAGVSKSFNNKMGELDPGGSGKVAFEASTKRGCSLSGKVEQTLTPVKDFVDSAKTKALGDMGELIPTDDFLQKEAWSGKYCSNKEECNKSRK